MLNECYIPQIIAYCEKHDLSSPVSLIYASIEYQLVNFTFLKKFWSIVELNVILVSGVQYSDLIFL